MYIKKNQLELPLLLLILGVLIKVTNSIFFPVSVIVNLCFLAFLVFYLVIQIKRKNGKKILLTVITLIFTLLPIYTQLEKSRFYLFEKQYMSLANKLEEEILKKEDTEGEYLKISPKYKYLTIHTGSIFYMKEKDHIVIGFAASSDFFTRYDFVYLSDSSGRLNKECDEFAWLKKPNWAYVKWY